MENLQEYYRRVCGGRLLRLLLIIGTFALGAYGQPAKVEKPLEKAAAPLVNENYKIGPGDVIDIAVLNNATLSAGGMRVSARGTIQLPMMEEETPAACRTERQLADQIKEKYKKYLVSPYVTVSVKEFNANPVALIGAVIAPGRFQIQRPTRLLELLILVNGPSPRAGRTIEIIRTMSRPRCEDGNLVVNTDLEISDDLISFTLADTMKGVDSANPYVQSGDIIMVGEAQQANAYIQGAVKNGTTVDLKDPVTLTDAIAMAGGLASGAAADKVVIRRQVPNSINRSELIVNLKEIKKGTREDVLLQRNDIVEVPGPSGVKKFLNSLVESVLPGISGLPLRVVY